MKTIRQIADEIGVSKTAVNKQIANLGLRSGLRCLLYTSDAADD